MDVILDVLRDTIIDALKLLPFLFLTYLVMEWLEHWTGGKLQEIVKVRKSRPGNWQSSRRVSAVWIFRSGGEFLCGQGYYARNADCCFFIHF